MSEDWGHDDCEVRAADRETGDTAPLEGSAAMWRQRAKSAEAEVTRLTKRTGELEYVESLYKADLLALDFIRTNDVPVEFLGKPIVAYAAHLIVESRNRIDELEAELPRPGMAATLEQELRSANTRIAELEAREARLREALEELIEVSDLRGDIDEIPHPCDDPKLWTARLISAWDNARAALEESE